MSRASAAASTRVASPTRTFEAGSSGLGHETQNSTGAQRPWAKPEDAARASEG